MSVDDIDRPRWVNTKFGKLVLHTQCQRTAMYRVQAVDGKIVVSLRQYGSSWTGVDPEQTNPGMFRELLHFLLRTQNTEPHYLNAPELKDIPERYLRVYPIRK